MLIGMNVFMPNSLIEKMKKALEEKGLRMTPQRGIIAEIISKSTDHPDIEELHKRTLRVDKSISIATIYRTVAVLEEAGIIERHEFMNNRSRYETAAEQHHDHIINLETNEIIEFCDPQIEELQKAIVEKFGFKLVSHRLELYCVPVKKPTS